MLLPRLKVERGLVTLTCGVWPVGFSLALGHIPTLTGR